MSALLIVLIALGLAGLSVFFTLQESRLARREVEQPPSVQPALEQVEVTPLEARRIATVAVPPSAILPTRARCGCGDPLAAHDRGPCHQCACDRFAYAGGLVPKAG